eukprot:gene10850-14566_t
MSSGDLNDALTTSIFSIAGVGKNMLLDKWEFLFGNSNNIDSTAINTENNFNEIDNENLNDFEDDNLISLEVKETSLDDANSVNNLLSASVNITKSDSPLIIPPQYNSLTECIDQNELPISDGQTNESKSKKKRMKKKAKEIAKHAKESRHVSWGSVEEICFTRSLGFSSIPNQGEYPCGLGCEIERQIYSIEDLFMYQQAQLMEKARILCLPSPNIHNFADSSLNGNHHYMATLFETRQYDYRHGVKNPLFTTFPENERIKVIMACKSEWSPAYENQADRTKDSFLSDINKEIKAIQSSRSTGGCSCRAVKLDKLSITKMRSELLNHGHLISLTNKDEINQLSKSDLTHKVRDVLKQCVLCALNNCECMQLDVSCIGALCGCLRGGLRAGHSQSCANPNGRDTFDEERVTLFRKKLLSDLKNNNSERHHDDI